jgi:hypothetical protein
MLRLCVLCVFVLLLLSGCAQAVKPVEFNACDSDVDCEPSNAVCFDGLGPTDRRRCMCQWGYTWDPLNHRCDLPDFVPTAAMVLVTRQSALYYTEQLNQTDVGVLQFTRGRSVLPTQWFCDASSGFCNSYDPSLGVEVANFNYSAVANASNSSSVPGVYQYWRCTAGRRPTRLNDNMIMNATVALKGYGMRPLWEYCPPCSVWCRHGACSADNTTCTCETGWFGPLCDQQSSLVSLGRYDAQRPCTFANETLACTGANEQCYIHRALSVAAGRAVGVCWCVPGTVPDPLTVWGGGCLLTANASVPSVLVDFVPNNADWRYFNATYTTAFPQYSWAQDATTLYALRGSATTGLTNPAWRLNASLLLLERCVALSDFFFRNLRDIIVVPGNQHAYCGFGGPAGSCGPLSVAYDAWAGTCECRTGVTGLYCDVCVGDFTGPNCTLASRAACRAQYCHGHGDCVDAAPLGTCACDRPYLADTACATTAAECGLTACSGHGECVDTATQSCVCDSGWKGARCDQTATACRTQRCSNAGQCATETQGCVCDPFRLRSNCSQLYCAYAQPVRPDGQGCSCNASFTGTYCETRKCGMFGDATGPNGACECFGVMALNRNNGTCTNHICGARGYPVAGRWCTCYAGSRLVQSDPVCQCQKPCSVYGTYNATTDKCICQVGFSGDLCELQLVTRLPVPREYTLLINWAFTAFLGVVVLVALWMPHLRIQYTHVRLGPTDAVLNTVLRGDGSMVDATM